jgi:hypothetical protein
VLRSVHCLTIAGQVLLTEDFPDALHLSELKTPPVPLETTARTVFCGMGNQHLSRSLNCALYLFSHHSLYTRNHVFCPDIPPLVLPRHVPFSRIGGTHCPFPIKETLMYHQFLLFLTLSICCASSLLCSIL